MIQPLLPIAYNHIIVFYVIHYTHIYINFYILYISLSLPLPHKKKDTQKPKRLDVLYCKSNQIKQIETKRLVWCYIFLSPLINGLGILTVSNSAVSNLS